ncbi:MAG: hypothetical protein AAGJ40_06755 [Planctomycetota bacterium]
MDLREIEICHSIDLLVVQDGRQRAGCGIAVTVDRVDRSHFASPAIRYGIVQSGVPAFVDCCGL